MPGKKGRPKGQGPNKKEEKELKDIKIHYREEIIKNDLTSIFRPGSQSTIAIAATLSPGMSIEEGMTIIINESKKQAAKIMESEEEDKMSTLTAKHARLYEDMDKEIKVMYEKRENLMAEIDRLQIEKNNLRPVEEKTAPTPETLSATISSSPPDQAEITTPA